MIKLAVDLLGADTDECELLAGAIEALKKNKDLFLYICGHKDKLEPVLNLEKEISGQYEIIDSPETLTNYDNPMEGYKKTDASMVKAMQLVKSGEAKGIVTCGPTGEVLVCSIMILGKLKGLRPILAAEMRSILGEPLLLLDCGANIDSRSELYASFAHLGDAYMKSIGKENPRIALLSNGAEDTKGCEAVKEANKLLHTLPINFVGNVEPTVALSGKCDVIVCDGFHGNILLKAIEGVAQTVLSQIEGRLTNVTDEMQKVLTRLRWEYDFNRQGGAVLLGVKAPVMKGHGSAKAESITAMVERMQSLIAGNFIDRVTSSL